MASFEAPRRGYPEERQRSSQPVVSPATRAPALPGGQQPPPPLTSFRRGHDTVTNSGGNADTLAPGTTETVFAVMRALMSTAVDDGVTVPRENRRSGICLGVSRPVGRV